MNSQFLSSLNNQPNSSGGRQIHIVGFIPPFNKTSFQFLFIIVVPLEEVWNEHVMNLKVDGTLIKEDF